MREKGHLSEEEILEMPLGSLINTLSRVHLAFLLGKIEEFGITGGQFQFLSGLSLKDGITQEELAKKFHMNQSTIARALKKLEDAGMVQRTTDKTNRRRNIITVTGKGQKTVQEINEMEHEWENKFKSLSPNEKDQLKGLLRPMATEAIGLMYEIRK